MENRTIGTVTVSKRALMQIVWYVTKHSKGVREVTDTTKKRSLSAMIFKKDEPEGVYITKTKKGILVDVCVVPENGVNSTSIKEKIAEKIKKAAYETGIRISDVNVRIGSPEK